MTRQARAVALLCSAILVLLGRASARAETLTTSTASLTLTPTNFGSASQALSGQDPLQIQQFNSQNGKYVLDAVDLQFHGKLTDNYNMSFVTPATISVTVGSGNPLTPGPQIGLFHPDGVTPFTGTLADGTTGTTTIHAPTDPNYWTRTVSYGDQPGQTLGQQFGSNFDPTSPFYLAPATTDQKMTLKLTSPTDLSLFSGTGTASLPVSASAFTSFVSTSGNGSGGVTTNAAADVTVTYEYHDNSAPEFIPEPGAFALWGLGGVGSLLIWRSRRQA